jgi:glycosyltransferase involved in cell wall biosynthesis
MKEKFKYVPKEQRKKILLICDDIRVTSGVATVAREMVINTAHHFNWVNIAGSITHPEKGKRLDVSADTNTNAGINDASVILYPTDGYGDSMLIRQLIELEKPDAIFLITDPRYFAWLFQIENEIRKHIPIIYLNIWDDYPAPQYNQAYYESCDALLGISKQTVNINKIVLGDKAKTKIIKYVPHGLNENVYFPIDEKHEKYSELQTFKKQLFKDKEMDFVLFFNSRNIRRKQIPDTLAAFRMFLDKLPKEKADKCAIVLHTEMMSDHGTDLIAVKEYLFEDCYPNAVVFHTDIVSPEVMNMLYNSSDAQILLTSNEGWGLSLTEALLVGNPIIANVTGGMQDQMRFENNGKWIDFDSDFPSNHTGLVKDHGKWAFPVFPSSRSIQGSIPTPYIWDDRCNAEDAAIQIENVYNLNRVERKALGLKGREWATSNEAGFTSEKMSNRIIEAIDELFATWKPREKFELINANEFKAKTLKHKLVY